MSARVVLLQDATCWHVDFAVQALPAPQLASLAPVHTPAHRPTCLDASQSHACMCQRYRILNTV